MNEDAVEKLSRAYHPEAWDQIDRLRAGADTPVNPASMWPDLRPSMREEAERRSRELMERMSAALSGAGLSVVES